MYINIVGYYIFGFSVSRSTEANHIISYQPKQSEILLGDKRPWGLIIYGPPTETHAKWIK